MFLPCKAQEGLEHEFFENPRFDRGYRNGHDGGFDPHPAQPAHRFLHRRRLQQVPVLRHDLRRRPRNLRFGHPVRRPRLVPRASATAGHRSQLNNPASKEAPVVAIKCYDRFFVSCALVPLSVHYR
ncbi:MAG: hypothetical protein JWN64_631 [Parcubacteria group bacterium]|nr:hypothetical protein [Parcubacteria group bacterium]